MTMQKMNTFMSKANYLAASGKKVLLINRKKSDRPEHLCIFFKSLLFAKKSMDHMNLQLYKAKADIYLVLVCTVLTHGFMSPST